MKKRYDELSTNISRLTTHTYSTSFALGIQLLEKPLRLAIYSIYGYVRVADEIVDSFEGYNKRQLLRKFRQDTFDALQAGISTNPILHSFQQAVREFRIGSDLIAYFLDSMEMDLGQAAHDRESYNKYIFGSAEVVGLMCLHVFTGGDKEEYEALKPFAMKLGAAFQKVNFLRDLRSDYQVLGRVYFPDVDMRRFTAQVKREIEEDIEKDFAEALRGIKRLRPSARAGVYLAYRYYLSLFRKIRRSPPQRILAGRLRINNGRKIGILIGSMCRTKLKWI